MSRWSRCAAGVLMAVSLLGGCKSTPELREDRFAVIELEAADRAAANTLALERKWAGRPTPSRPPADGAAAEALPLDLRLLLPADEADNAAESVDEYQMMLPAWQFMGARTAPTPGDSPVLLVVQRPGVSIAFAGVPVEGSRDPMMGGVARITLSPRFVEALSSIQPEPTVRQSLLLALQDVGPEDLVAYRELAQAPDYAQVMRLVDGGVDPGWAWRLNHAGYALTVEELLQLRAADVSADDAVSLRKGGFDYDADALLALRRADVPADYALGLKEAGYAESPTQIITVFEAGVTTEYAAAMRSRGVAEEAGTLIDLHHAAITAKTIDTYRLADQDPSAGELLRLHAAGVDVMDVLAYHHAGYRFTVDDLLLLARWRVPISYTLALVSDEHAALPASQIVDLRLRSVTPEMVAALRAERGAQGTVVTRTQPGDLDLPELPELDVEAP